MTLDTRSSSKRTLPWPALIPVGQLAGKPAIPLARPVTLVGSRHTANVRINSSTVSKAHALILNSDGRLLIRDLASRTGTLVNNEAVREVELSEGDIVQLGRFTFRFAAGPPSRMPRRKRKVAGARLDLDMGESVPLNQRVVLVGQRGSTDVPISDPDVSTAHCVIFDMNGKRYVRDLGSRTGTFVNDQGAVQMEIRPGDTIRVGQTVLRYVPDDSVVMTEDGEGRAQVKPAGSGSRDNGRARPAAPVNDVDLALDLELPAPEARAAAAPVADEDAPLPLDLDDFPGLTPDTAMERDETPLPLPLPDLEAAPAPEAMAPAVEEERTTTWSTDPHGEAHVVNVERPDEESIDLAMGAVPLESAEQAEAPADAPVEAVGTSAPGQGGADAGVAGGEETPSFEDLMAPAEEPVEARKEAVSAAEVVEPGPVAEAAPAEAAPVETAAAEAPVEEDAAFDLLMNETPAPAHAPAPAVEAPVDAPVEALAEEPVAEEALAPEPQLAEEAAKAEPAAEDTWTTSGADSATPDVVALDLPLEGEEREDRAAETETAEALAEQGTGEATASASLADLPFGDEEPVDLTAPAESVEATSAAEMAPIPVEVDESAEEAIELAAPELEGVQGVEGRVEEQGETHVEERVEERAGETLAVDEGSESALDAGAPAVSFVGPEEGSEGAIELRGEGLADESEPAQRDEGQNVEAEKAASVDRGVDAVKEEPAEVEAMWQPQEQAPAQELEEVGGRVEDEQQREEPLEPVVEPVDEPVSELKWEASGVDEARADAVDEAEAEVEAAEEPLPLAEMEPAGEPQDEAVEEAPPVGAVDSDERTEEAWQPEANEWQPEDEVEAPEPVAQDVASDDVLAVFEVNEDVSVADEEGEHEGAEDALDLSVPEEVEAEGVATASGEVVAPEEPTTSSTEIDWEARISERVEMPTVESGGETAEAVNGTSGAGVDAEAVAAEAMNEELPPFEMPELDLARAETVDGEDETPLDLGGDEAVEVEGEAVAPVFPEPEGAAPEAVAETPEVTPVPPPEPSRPAGPVRSTGSEYLLGEDPSPNVAAPPPQSARAMNIQFFSAPTAQGGKSRAPGLVTMTLPGMLPGGPSVSTSGNAPRVVPTAPGSTPAPVAPGAPAKPQFQVVNTAPTKTITITPQQYAEPAGADALSVEKGVVSGPPPQLITPPAAGTAPSPAPAPIQPAPAARPVVIPPRPTNLSPSARTAEYRVRPPATSLGEDVIVGVATGTAGNVRIQPVESPDVFGTSGSATSSALDESQDVFSIGANNLFGGEGPADPQVKVAPIPEFTLPPSRSRVRGPVIPPKVAEWQPQGAAAAQPVPISQTAPIATPMAPATPVSAVAETAGEDVAPPPPAAQSGGLMDEQWPGGEEDLLDEEGLTATAAEQRMLLGETPRGHVARPRKNRRERVLLLMAMVIAMIGAAYAVWKIFIPKVMADGVILFDHLGNLPPDQQKAFEQRQLALLGSAEVRQAAQRILQKDHPTVNAGFLTDPTGGATLEPPSLKIDSATRRGELRVRLSNGDEQDTTRLMALMRSVYAAQDNDPMRSTAAARQRELQTRRDALALEEARMAALRQRQESLEGDLKNRPAPIELKVAREGMEEARAALNSAQIARGTIEGELRRLQSGGADATATAGADDPALRKLNEQLAVANARIADAKAANAKAALDARKAMTSAMDQFQANLTQAQALLKDNPAMRAYIESAQKLQETSWKLQNDLIDRQETLRQRLVDRRKRYEEVLERRNQKLIEQDPDLRELAELQEQKLREVAAAKRENRAKDVIRLDQDLDLIRGQIAERKLTLGSDEFIEALLGDLKQDIETTSVQLEKDRTESEKMLLEAEAAFRKAAPVVGDLPKDRQSLPGQLTGNVEALQAARKAYADAIKAQDDQANEALKTLQADQATIQAAIDARQRELTGAQQKDMSQQQQALIKEKQEALKAAGDLASRLERELNAATGKYQKLEDRELAYTRAAGILGENELAMAVKQVERLGREVDAAQEALRQAVIPREPTVSISDKADPRGLYMSGAMGGVALLFGVFMVAGGSGRQEGDDEEMGEQAHSAEIPAA